MGKKKSNQPDKSGTTSKPKEDTGKDELTETTVEPPAQSRVQEVPPEDPVSQLKVSICEHAPRLTTACNHTLRLFH